MAAGSMTSSPIGGFNAEWCQTGLPCIKLGMLQSECPLLCLHKKLSRLNRSTNLPRLPVAFVLPCMRVFVNVINAVLLPLRPMSIRESNG